MVISKVFITLVATCSIWWYKLATTKFRNPSHMYHILTHQNCIIFLDLVCGLNITNIMSWLNFMSYRVCAIRKTTYVQATHSERCGLSECLVISWLPSWPMKCDSLFDYHILASYWRSETIFQLTTGWFHFDRLLSRMHRYRLKPTKTTHRDWRSYTPGPAMIKSSWRINNNNNNNKNKINIHSITCTHLPRNCLHSHMYMRLSKFSIK